MESLLLLLRNKTEQDSTTASVGNSMRFPGFDIKKAYRIHLCQDENRRRYYEFTAEGEQSFHAVFSSDLVPGKLIEEISTGGMGLQLRKSTGRKFVFSAHGWWTESERKDLKEKGWDRIEWVTEESPIFPPK